MPELIDNTYLGNLFHLDRKLSFWVAGFFLVTICCSLFRLEATPFFVWGMYSAIEKPQSGYPVLGIKVNGTDNIDLYDGVSDNSRFFLLSPLQYYKELKENNDIDPALTILKRKFSSFDFASYQRFNASFNKSTQLRGFAPWYARFLAAQTGKKIKSLTATAFSATFTPDGKLIVDSGHVFLQWP